MRKLSTALWLAIAVLFSSAAPVRAIAPVINDLRSPIIADDTPATNSNNFVYPDAIRLINFAVDPDDTVPRDEIKWSFFENSGTYGLNNRTSLNLTADDPVDPGIKEITGGSVEDDPDQADNDLRTVTIRNVALSPLPLPAGGIYADSAANGGNIGPQILTAQTKVVTLFASDGQLASSKSMLVYTENKGVDRLSGAIILPPFPRPEGWTSTVVIGPPGFNMFSSPTNGLCIQSPLAGAAFGVWSSPFGAFTLVQNNVYRIRINVESTVPLAAGATPLWDFVIDNVKTDAAGNLIDGSEGKYSLDVLNWDTNGNANSVGLASGGRRTFDIWYTPLAVNATDWNDPTFGEFRSSREAFNDGRFQFRVIDVQVPNGVDGDNDAGTLCLKGYQVDRIDIHDLTVAATVYNNSAPSGEFKNSIPGFQNAGSNMSVGTIFPGSTMIDNTSGTLTVMPNGPQWADIEIIDLDVGDDNIDFAVSATLPDNWPITWNSNELLRITAGGLAPNIAGELNPPDTLRLLMDSPTSEIGMDSLLSAGANILGMPKQTAATNYTAFFHTQNRTAATATGYAALRPRVSLLNIHTVFSNGSANNVGGFRLTFLRVDRMNPVD